MWLSNQPWRLRVLTVVACSLIALPAAAQDSAAPTLNTLRGIVVSKEDGRPLARVPVVMAHARRAHLRLGSAGIGGSGENLTEPGAFVSRNAKVVCEAVSAADGTFVLRSFCTPREPWILAAGDPQRGFCLRPGVVPAELAEAGLRLEIEPPAFVEVARLPEPPKASFQASLDFAIVDAAAGGRARDSDIGGLEDLESRINVYAWPQDYEADVWRLGPLPPGYTYRVTHSMWSPALRYPVTLFERSVTLRPGATERVSLESESGVALQGRIADTNNRALADVNVLIRMRGDGAFVMGALTDADGRYTLAHVPAGTHTLELLRHAKPTAPI